MKIYSWLGGKKGHQTKLHTLRKEQNIVVWLPSERVHNHKRKIQNRTSQKIIWKDSFVF